MNRDIINVDPSELIRVVREAAGAGCGVRITVVGNSMYPFLRSGADSAELYPPDDIKRGDVVFYLRGDGSCVLHRCIGIKNGEYIMCGDNQTQKEPGVRRSDIIAAARVFYRKDKRVTDKTWWYRIYVFFWCTLFFLRPAESVVLKGIRRVRRSFSKKKKSGCDF